MANSVGLSGEELIKSLPQLECPLCVYKSFPSHHQLKRHFQSLHLSHSTVIGCKISVLCKLDCEDATNKKAHYHCSECKFTAREMNRLNQHFDKHKLPAPKMSPVPKTIAVLWMLIGKFIWFLKPTLGEMCRFM